MQGGQALLLLTHVWLAGAMMPIIAPMMPAPVVSQRVTGMADAETPVAFQIYLKIPQDEQAKLTATLNAVSDPSSPEYGTSLIFSCRSPHTQTFCRALPQ